MIVMFIDNNSLSQLWTWQTTNPRRINHTAAPRALVRSCRYEEWPTHAPCLLARSLARYVHPAAVAAASTVVDFSPDPAGDWIRRRMSMRELQSTDLASHSLTHDNNKTLNIRTFMCGHCISTILKVPGSHGGAVSLVCR